MAHTPPLRKQLGACPSGYWLARRLDLKSRCAVVFALRDLFDEALQNAFFSHILKNAFYLIQKGLCLLCNRQAAKDGIYVTV